VVDFKTLQASLITTTPPPRRGRHLKRGKPKATKITTNAPRTLMLTYTAPRQSNEDPLKRNSTSTSTTAEFLPQLIEHFGGTHSDFSFILGLAAREVALKHISYFNVGFT